MLLTNNFHKLYFTFNFTLHVSMFVRAKYIKPGSSRIYNDNYIIPQGNFCCLVYRNHRNVERVEFTKVFSDSNLFAILLILPFMQLNTIIEYIAYKTMPISIRHASDIYFLCDRFYDFTIVFIDTPLQIYRLLISFSREAKRRYLSCIKNTQKAVIF